MPPLPLKPQLSLILPLPFDFVSLTAQDWQNQCQKMLQAHLSVPHGPSTQQPPTQPEWLWLNLELATIPVATIRELVSQLSFGVAPNQHRWVMILRADLAQTAAQTALLKLVEEPPARTTLVLATTNQRALLPTLIS
ncbi:MAG TPA: hypothetical protein DEP87_04620, partial [Candidatus Pacebacteria bacterium]|nr:hypothetical protein [Candidatus Paceibacterota bacterium]